MKGANKGFQLNSPSIEILPFSELREYIEIEIQLEGRDGEKESMLPCCCSEDCLYGAVSGVKGQGHGATVKYAPLKATFISVIAFL